jgi:hypothetical protein
MLRVILAAVVLMPLCAQAQNATPDPVTLPARDAHQNLLIAADPYLGAQRYKGVFGKKSPYDAGILAIDVYFRNDNDVPIRVRQEAIQLVFSPPGGNRQHLESLSPEEVVDRTLLKPRNPQARFPLPSGGTRAGRNKEWFDMVSTVRTVALGTDILPPHNTTHGFIFFDLDHDFDSVHNSQLYIPDLTFMTDRKALFFFEIDLGDARAK